MHRLPTHPMDRCPILDSINESMGPGSGDLEMRNSRGGRDGSRGRGGSEGRELVEELRASFQHGIDGLEELSSKHLDRIARRSAEELAQLREELERQRHSSRSHRRSRSSRRRHGRRRSRRPKREADRDTVETEHERIVRRARRRVNQRIGFISHFGCYLATLAIILVASRSLRVVMLVALTWGIGVFIHYLAAIAAPRLRERWVRDEVGARSPRAVASERERVETRSRRSMEDLSASIAHEIRNPITAAKSLVQQMGEDPGSSENLEYAEVALAELDRVERSISHLLRYARDEEPRFEAVALEDITRAAAEGLRDPLRSAGVSLTVEFDCEGAMRGDPEKLRRVFENLIANALDALSGSAIENPHIEILGGENLAGSEVWVRVLDNGPGIPERDRERIWSPFHTTKETGTGLGLALSRKTVEAHGGRIDLEAIVDDGRGSAFVLSFPKEPRESTPQDAGVRA